MQIIIDPKKSIYELVKTYPEIQNIMADLGFHDILKHGMLETAGRFMTIKKGAKLKKIPLEIIKIAFHENGFELTDTEV